MGLRRAERKIWVVQGSLQSKAGETQNWIGNTANFICKTPKCTNTLPDEVV